MPRVTSPETSSGLVGLATRSLAMLGMLNFQLLISLVGEIGIFSPSLFLGVSVVSASPRSPRLAQSKTVCFAFRLSPPRTYFME